jgi:hypothetical protein
VPTFVLRLTARRPNFAQTLTDAEREIMGQHAAHWGPVTTGTAVFEFGQMAAGYVRPRASAG